MAVIALTGKRRESLGKGGARKSRAAGQIPGILYGHGETPLPVAVEARAFQLALHQHKGGNAIIALAVDGGEHTALIRDVQYDPISHAILHLDFQKVSLTETVEVEVALHLTGVPIGVKDGGGVLEHITRTVEVRCLPTAIPSSIEVDVSRLNIGDSAHVSEISVPDVEVLSDPDTTIATVVPPTVFEEKPAEEVAAAATTEAAEPELSVERGKKEEEGAEAKGGDKGKEKGKKE
jgi:large subunit ribosomal protein L25